MRRGLAEAEAQVDQQILLGDAGHFGSKQALHEETMDLGHHVVVMRVGLHVAGLALHVHQHHRHPGIGGRVQRALLTQAEDVVDHAGAGLHGRSHHLRLEGVDADRHGGAGRKLFDHRQHALQFFFHRHRRGTRAARLATDIEQVGALLHQLQAVGHGRVGAVVRATIGERIRGDIDDAHDPGAVQAQDAAGAVELGGDIEHGQSCGQQRLV